MGKDARNSEHRASSVQTIRVLHYADTRRSEPNHSIRPIGRVTRAIRVAYERFGVQLGDPDRVKQRGYLLLKALRESAFERRGRAYAVRHVGAWLAFAAMLKTLVLGMAMRH